jgi:hypothetical protein
MSGTRVRRGASKFIIPVVIVVAVAFASVYLLVGQSSLTPRSSSEVSKTTSSSSVTETYSGPLPSTPVKAAVDQWLKDFNDRDVEGLANFYGFSSDVIWTGNTAGLQGGYAGAGSIRILYGSTIGKTTQLIARSSNYTEKQLSPVNINVTMTLKLNGNSSVLGALNGTIIATQDWFFTSGQWQIVKENWNYKAFDVQYPASSTTFPQWGALRQGNSPELVSEKSLEWRAGPIAAAAIYVLLAGVISFPILKSRTRRRP